MNNLNMQRIMKEKREIEANPPTQFTLYPLHDDLFEWHFTLTGPVDTDYEGGLYHGRIILPKNFPLSPPDIIFMTVVLQLLSHQVDSKLELKYVYP